MIRDYIQKIIMPYVGKMRQKYELGVNYLALLLFDNFKAQELLRDNDPSELY